MEEEKKKYNYGEPIDLDIIPISDCEQALHEFSNGSIGLEKCLRAMWMHGLKTHSCKKGKNSFDIGEIIMAEGEDLFNFLSISFIFDERIRIDYVDGKERVRFAGTSAEKEGAMLYLTRDIQSGRKYNRKQVEENLGKPYPDSWLRRLKSHEANINSTYWSEKVYIQEKVRTREI